MRTLRVLYKIGLLTPVGLWFFFKSISKEGVNLMTLLAYAAHRKGSALAFTEGEKRLSYREVYNLSNNIPYVLVDKYQLAPKQRIALLSRNSIEMLATIFAVSRTGADLFLLNPDFSPSQISNLLNQKKFNLVIHDKEQIDIFVSSEMMSFCALDDLATNAHGKVGTNLKKLAKQKAGKIAVLSGGTSSSLKTAERQPGIFSFLSPLVALIEEMKLQENKKVFMPLPLYHGYGLATSIVAVLLGTENYIQRKFNAKQACEWVNKEGIEVMTVVPQMLQRMLAEDAMALKKVQKILSGGAALDPSLVQTSFLLLNAELYNLYGTSEVGFCVMATSKDLKQHPNSIGKAIRGAKFRISEGKEIGSLEMKTTWAMLNTNNKWYKTGDLASINNEGYIFLKGREGESIVSGGENVFLKDVEDVLMNHPEIVGCAVIGVKDENYGEALKAYIELDIKSELKVEEIMDWLKPRLARFEIPKSIEILEEIPRTFIGKIDKKRLS